MGLPARTMMRGLARPSDLSTALDELGVGEGETFIIARAELLDEREPERAPKTADANALGGFTAETSRQAALDHYPRSGTARMKALEALVEAGARGATSDEIAQRKSMRLYTVKPRLIELRRGGWARRTGGARPSSTGSAVDVYVATPEGEAVVRRQVEHLRVA